MENQRLWLRVGLAATLAVAAGCEKGGTRATAMLVTSRDQLVGGPRALGDVGDFVLSNGRVRAVVQGPSASRGFGVFGGSLIDLDLERPRETDEGKPVGGDGLAEIFPAFFLRGLEPEEVFVKNDGSNGEPAIVTARGKGSEFITMVTGVNDLLLGPGFSFEIDYVLEPIAADAPPEAGRSILIRATAKNVSEETIYLAVDAFPVGFGLVVLMGSEHQLFLPGEAGWDLRYTLEDAYKKPIDLPGMPGVVSRALAASGDKVSYVITPEPSEKNNFVYAKKDLYPDATKDSLLIPFVSSSFTGLFFHQPPKQLEPGRSTSFEARIWVGSGDIASAMDLALAAKGEPLGTYSATVREEGTGVPVEGATVSLIEESSGKVLSSARSYQGGRIHLRLPPGRYLAAAVGANRKSARGEPFDLAEGQTVGQELSIGRQAFLSASVVDQTGRPIPAKLSVIGRYGAENAGKPTNQFLFDLKIGEPYRYSDMAEDDPARPETLEYIERVLLGGNDGHAEGAVRPGKYRIVASRGIAYTTAEQEVELEPGQAKHLQLKLEKVVEMPGYVSADFHVHTRNSIDSPISLNDRALTFAAEGVDYLSVTDHNYISDLGPTVEGLGLGDWIKPAIGIELTTLELGHFNGYPLRRDPGPITHGSFDWFRNPAQTIFDRLRERSALPLAESVVQVNHPRDTILGYFNSFSLDEENALPSEKSGLVKPTGPEFENSAWSEEFDALELLNGKRTEFIHTYRVPETLPPPPLPAEIPPAGEILRNKDGKPAFPGGFEDWVTMMKRGRVFTGTANSDTHKILETEGGYPRNLVRIGKSVSTARAIEDADIARAIKHQASVMTFGPYVELFANDAAIGELTQAGAGGAVNLHVRVSAAPWIDVSRIMLIGSDGTKESIPVTGQGVVRADTTITRTVSGDAFFLVEVSGDKSMWPVCPGNEIAPLAIEDAVKSIGGPFGFGSDGFGNLRPAIVHPVTPYAMTNPVWVDADGDGASFGKGKLSQSLRSQPLPPEKTGPRSADLLQLFRALSR